MKYIVALTVIASVAAGSLRTSTKDDNDAPVVKAFIEMKENRTNSRKLQMGMETTRVGETSLMMEQKTEEEEDQGQSQLFNRVRQKAKTTRGTSTPATEIHMKDKTEGVLPDAEDNEDLDVKIVGGDVSGSNEFPYFGTSLHLPVTHK